MDSHPKWRSRALSALASYFQDRSFPRSALTLIVTISGFVGFLISHILLHHGFEDMWLRYPISAIGGYLTFLSLLRFWVEIERARCSPIEIEIPTAVPEKPDSTTHKKFIGDSASWLDWLDVPFSALEGGESCMLGCMIILVVGLMAGAASLLFSTIMAAPEILAEIFLDAVVMTMFYRHLKTAAKGHWLGTAVKRTWRPALLIALALGILGIGLSIIAPGSHSIGSALHKLFNGKSSP